MIIRKLVNNSATSLSETREEKGREMNEGRLGSWRREASGNIFVVVYGEKPKTTKALRSSQTKRDLRKESNERDKCSTTK